MNSFRKNFGPADGILGLAFNALNSAFDLKAYLAERAGRPAGQLPMAVPRQHVERGRTKGRGVPGTDGPGDRPTALLHHLGTGRHRQECVRFLHVAVRPEHGLSQSRR